MAKFAPMPLHLLKLCVGIDSLGELQAYRTKRGRKAGQNFVHVTRMVPRRIDELLDGGSLYWVIKGQIAARQVLRAIEPFIDRGGIGRCRLVLDSTIVPVVPRPFRAFQGWRYFPDRDRPPDLSTKGSADMPLELRQELASLGLM